MKDLIIVGGGLMGAALAQQAASLGLGVILVEAGVIGAEGATAHSRGMVRVYDPHPELMRWALRGAAEWTAWALPFPSPFVRCGLTYFVAPANHDSALAALAAHDHEAYPIRILGEDMAALPAPLRHLWQRGGLVLYEPFGGHVDTRLAARLFAQAARMLGGSLLEGSPVLGIDEGRDSARVRLAHGELYARHVVLATGAATPALARIDGLFSRSIPLSCIAQAPGRALQGCVIDEVSGAYARPDGADFLYCGGAPQHDAPTPAALTYDVAAAGRHNLALARHLCGDGALGLLDTRQGYDAYTASLLPRLDLCPGFQRVRLATGFSGRGAKYIPAVARMLASRIALLEQAA